MVIMVSLPYVLNRLRSSFLLFATVNLFRYAIASYCLREGIVRDGFHLPGLAFKKFDDATIFKCASSCMAHSICKSINFYQKEKTCFLNVAAELPGVNDLEAEPDSIYSDINNWPLSVAGVCQGHECRDSELCVETPLKTQTCVPDASFDVNFVIYTDELSWDDAVKKCASRSGKLAIPDTEEKFIKMRQVVSTSANNHPDVSYLWVGGREGDNADTWTWLDGTEMVFSNWIDGQPNQYQNGNPPTCLLVKHDSTALWYDWWCSTKYPYMCEYVITL